MPRRGHDEGGAGDRGGGAEATPGGAVGRWDHPPGLPPPVTALALPAGRPGRAMSEAGPEIEVGEPKRPPRASWARWYILLGLLLPFTALTYLAVSSGSPSDVRDRPVISTTLATITGPFVGAIARNGQSCCLRLSLTLAAVCGPVLALGLIAQVLPLRSRRVQVMMRIGL